MQSDYPASFERDTGGTEGEWLARLPHACRGLPMRIEGRHACVAIEGGHLHLDWQVLPPREIALLRFPRLMVSFRFGGVTRAAREAFMRHFDLYMQRGGG
jgi:hypothetical protein